MIPLGVLEYNSTILSQGFKTRWYLPTNGLSITLPTSQNRTEGALAYDYNVDWGDGSSNHITTWNDTLRTHTYTSAGNYTIEIKGTMEGWSFADIPTSRNLITQVIYWGDSSVFNGFTYLYGAFSLCQNLVSLGTGKILASGGGVEADGFDGFCSGCSLITKIPNGLFDNHPNVYNFAFTNAFGDCSSVAVIPDNLFDVHISVHDYAFAGCFTGTAISTIPSDLFLFNTDVGLSGFNQCFQDCIYLSIVPKFLFRYNTNVNSGFVQTFSGCPALIIDDNIFYGLGEETTRFAGSLDQDFTNCFLRTLGLGINGTAPDLWNCTFGGAVTSAGCFGGAGNSIITLTNYTSIPGGWK